MGWAIQKRNNGAELLIVFGLQQSFSLGAKMPQRLGKCPIILFSQLQPENVLEQYQLAKA